MQHLLFVFALLSTAAAATLEQPTIAITLDDRTGALTSVTNRLTGETWQVAALPFTLETDRGVVAAEGPLANRLQPASAEYDFGSPNLAITVRYQLQQGYLTKLIRVRNTSSEALILERVKPEVWSFKPAFRQVHEHRDPSQFRWLINVFLRGEKGGLYAGVENTIYQSITKGSTPADTHLEFAYSSHIPLKPGEIYESDTAFLGVYRKEGIYLFKELQKLESAVNRPKAIPSALNFDQEILDWGEVWAMQDYMRSRQPPHSGGFYVRAVAMVGGRKTSDLQETAGFHIAFGPEHVVGSKRFVDDVASLGHVPHIEWATEWFGNGGYGNPTPDLALENAEGLETPVNPHWREVVSYAFEKHIKTGIFETISRDFARFRNDYKVLLPDGSPMPMNCWANRQYVQWRLEVTAKAIEQQKLHMVAWDAIVPKDWSWLGWPDLKTECFSPQHGHLKGDIRYPLFRNIVWFLGQLQQRYPQVYLRVASGLTTAYPWALQHLIEYHPNFYDGETGATYWTSYNYRFLPMYKSGVLLSATKKADFEYLLLRSISTSDHFMLWPDAVGIALENRAFWTRWLTWADRNIEYLRVGRTLFREPWGDSLVASLPPALEGRLPAQTAEIHGSAHIKQDRGFLFLFNPSDQERVASVPINHWIGLTEGQRFGVKVIYPNERAHGTYERGEELRIAVPARGSMILELEPSEAHARKPQVPSGLPVDRAFFKFEEIPWAEIAVRP